MKIYKQKKYFRMNKKIVFIVNTIRQARCSRRIEEFVEHGYPVEVYGFDREGDKRSLPNFPFKIIGTFQNGSNYLVRTRQIRDAVKEVINLNNKDEVVFYLFNLDIAIAFRSIVGSGKFKYIYEVSDLAELIVPNTAIRKFLIWQNKRAMKKALHNVFTSEGFCEYYNSIPRNKITVIPNRVDEKCSYKEVSNRSIDLNKIKIGFVGIIRFETVYNFAKVCKRFSNVEFHLFGLVSKGDEYAKKLEELINESANIYLHGPFKNPQDLPPIYEGIDMVLSAYPPTLGVRYAEPNKLYEAILFRCPIIVNDYTFLAEKVRRLNVGFVINALNESDIERFIKGIDEITYQDKVKSCLEIPQKDCLNINDGFFEKLRTIC
jgi:glycosyltransferase involved in cell wall biosynthesis